ncbi:MAG: amidase [Acidobacteriota bacterium]|nr:amidase [Acidobacteriota bacterium]
METITSAAAALRRGETTARALVEHAIGNHAAHGEATNAFIAFTPDDARAEAMACDEEAARGAWRGPLHGIPISFKDLIDVAGTVTTAGSRVLPDTPAARDADVAARLRAAGAISLGKTNLHEFAFGTTSEDSAFGAVRHPLDRDRMAGGSSGGSAAAVATGVGLGSVGTDTGGSIRIPAALCGLVGLKPTFGEVSTDGVIPLSRSFDHVGPIARTVDDAWVMWSVMTGAPQAPRVDRDARGLTLGVPAEYFFDLLEDTVRAAWDRAVAMLTRAGARLQPVSIPDAAATSAAYVPIVFHESWAWHQGHIERCPEGYTAAVRARLEMGQSVGIEEYQRALAARASISAQVDAALTGVDALVLPTMAVTAPRLGTPDITFGERVEPVRAVMLRLTQLFDISGHPAVTIPVPQPGLPVGFQLAGRRHETAALLTIAKATERVFAQGA